MTHLVVVAATAAVAFVGTNTDDFVTLLLLTVGIKADRHTWTAIISGQYLGFCVLLIPAVAGAVLFSLVNARLVGLLGILPIALGIRGLTVLVRRPAAGGPPDAALGGVLAVAVLTIANGGDNLAVYIPLYRDLRPGDMITTTATFLVMLGALCVLALGLGRFAQFVPGAVRVCRWATPLVYLAIGVLLLAGVVTRHPVLG